MTLALLLALLTTGPESPAVTTDHFDAIEINHFLMSTASMSSTRSSIETTKQSLIGDWSNSRPNFLPGGKRYGLTATAYAKSLLSASTTPGRNPESQAIQNLKLAKSTRKNPAAS